MFQIFVSGQDKAVETVNKLPAGLLSSQNKAFHAVGQNTIASMRLFIESGGAGIWPKPNIMSRRLKFENRWIIKDRPANFFELGKFSRYVAGSSFFITGFGSREKSGKIKFNPILMKYADNLQGKKIPITSKMRKKFGATRWLEDFPVIGKNFFPFKRGKQTINIPNRMITYNGDEMLTIFVRSLENNLEKKLDK